MTTGTNQPWPEDRVQALRSLWSEGRAVREIAATLGVTRDAVAGKAKRLGLPLHPNRPMNIPQRTMHEPRVPDAWQGCRWIEGEPVRSVHVCGRPTVMHRDGRRRSSYCKEHHVRVWSAQR